MKPPHLMRPGSRYAREAGIGHTLGVHDSSTDAIRTFNVAVHAHPRIEMVRHPIGDGLTLARKRF